MKPHLFPFLRANAEGELNSLYKRVVSTMLAIHGGSQEPRDLVVIAMNWYDLYIQCIYKYMYR